MSAYHSEQAAYLTRQIELNEIICRSAVWSPDTGHSCHCFVSTTVVDNMSTPVVDINQQYVLTPGLASMHIKLPVSVPVLSKATTSVSPAMFSVQATTFWMPAGWSQPSWAARSNGATEHDDRHFNRCCMQPCVQDALYSCTDRRSGARLYLTMHTCFACTCVEVPDCICKCSMQKTWCW